MTKTWQWKLALAGLVLATAAHAAEPAKKGVEVDACKLLSDKDVAAAIGLPVDPGLRNDAGFTEANAYSSTCLWAVSADKDVKKPNLPLGGKRFAILNVQSWPPGTDAGRSFVRAFKAAGEQHLIKNKPEDVKIGDEAVWWGSGVAVHKGDYSFGMSVHLIDRPERQRGMEEALSKQIVARLPK